MEVLDKNQLFELAVNFANQTNSTLFVTGKAGTGKTTFLRHIVKNTLKKTVIVAPTGVAAINAGGVTIHSLFQLPFGLFLPEHNYSPDNNQGFSINNTHTLIQNARINKSKRKLLQEIELLIIDEVSMVKADTMDAIDTLLRHVRNKHYEPFGGVQLLCIGDLYQLPPVVREDEWSVMSQYYKSPFFFDSKAFGEVQLVCIEFEKIYRQSNLDYIKLLNRIRENRANASDLEELNSKHFNPDFVPPKEVSYITLCSHNAIADRINQEELDELEGMEYAFDAVINGEFNENSYPTYKTLKIKIGAQIMFIKNDIGNERRYYNGKIGKVDSISAGEVFVSFEGENELLKLEQVEWENIRYSFNDTDKKIEEKRLGSFKQFPIRLAWAVTIHKSQGLTFDRAIVDAGSSFSDGQVYVALSRLTSPEGLVLKTRIHQNSIMCSNEVIAFMQQVTPEYELEPLLKNSQKEYIKHLIANSFDWQKLEDLFVNFRMSLEDMRVPDRVLTDRFARKTTAQITEQNKVANNFILTLKKIIPQAEQDNFQFLSQRIEAASKYFTKALEEEILIPFAKYQEDIKKEIKTKKFQTLLRALHEEVELKKNIITQTHKLVEGLAKGLDGQELLDVYYDSMTKASNQAKIGLPSVKIQKPEKGQSQKESLDLFKSGKTIEEIAAKRGFAESTIEGHFARFVLTGDLSVFDLMEKEKVAKVLETLKSNPEISMGDVKARLGENFSFSEIRYALKTEAGK